MKSYNGIDIREIVNNAEWQLVRRNMLGKWKKEPESCVNQLKSYLGWDDEMKLVRVFNYLTGSGFRLKVIGNASSRNLKEEVERRLLLIHTQTICVVI